MKQTSERQKYLLSALFYVLLVLIFFYPVLQGLIITQTDNLNFISPWNSVKPNELTKATNQFLQDQSTEFLPFFMEAKRQFSEGLFPLWNPYIFAGNPLWANTQSALLYPLNLFHYVLPAPVGFTVSSLLKLFFGCFLTHIYCRKLKVNHGPALLAGVAFGFCSFTVFWLNHPHSNVTPLIPLCLYAVERLLQKADLRNMLLFSLVVALTLIAGHVEIAFLTATGCGLYYLLRLVQMRKLSIWALSQFFIVYIIGLLLSAILIFPFIEFLFNTAIWTERGEDINSSIPTAGLINLFMGDFFRFDGWNPRNIGYHAFSAFIGVAALPLVLFGVVKSFRLTMPLLLVCVFSMAVSFSINPINWIVKNLPLFNHLPLFYFNALVAFTLSVLAAIGLQQCINKTTDTIRPLLWVVMTLLAALIYFRFFWHPGGLSPHTLDVDLLLESVRSFVPWIALILLVICVLIYFAQWINQSLFIVLMVGTVFVDLWLVGHDWNPVIKAEYGLPREKPGSLKFLSEQSEPFRTVGYHYILTPSTNMLAQIHDVRGYDVPVIDRYHQFFNRALKGKDSFWFYSLPEYDATILPFLNLLNARYLLAKRELKAIPAHINLVYNDEILIYENQHAAGLASLKYQAEFVDSSKRAFDRVIALNEQLDQLVVIEAGSELSFEPQDSQAVQNNNIEYTSINSQNISLQVESQKPAWLVMSQSFYPGWKAYVNGNETEIFAANYVLQAIKIPSGTHQVAFKYQPLSFTLGWMVSLFTLIVVLWKIRKTK